MGCILPLSYQMVRRYFFSFRASHASVAPGASLLTLVVCLLVLSGCSGATAQPPDPVAPPVQPAVAQLAITTTALPTGGVGSSYSATLGAQGGVPPYTWSIASGALPGGLTLQATSGAIAGVPNQAENMSFTAEVTDASVPAHTASEALGISIAAAVSGAAASACSVLGTAGETYTLQNDVSSAGTCFSVQAENVTLNLNGHTISYNTGNQTPASFAILGIACWDPDINGIASGNPCGGTFDNFTVYGGNIVEGSGAAGSYAHAIRLGQGLNRGPTIHDLSITWWSNSAAGIYLDYAGQPVPGAAVIFNNTFHNRVTSILSRVNIDGTFINIEQAEYNSVPRRFTTTRFWVDRRAGFSANPSARRFTATPFSRELWEATSTPTISRCMPGRSSKTCMTTQSSPPRDAEFRLMGRPSRPTEPWRRKTPWR